MLIMRNLNLISVQSWTYLPQNGGKNRKHGFISTVRPTCIVRIEIEAFPKQSSNWRNWKMPALGFTVE